MRKTITTLIGFTLLLFFTQQSLYSQSKTTDSAYWIDDIPSNMHEFSCPHDHINTQRLENDIDYAREKADYERKYQDAMKGIEDGSRALSDDCPSFDGVYHIPVVWHIVHEGAALGSEENPTDADLINMIGFTNNRFRHTSGATFTNPFSGVDTQIELCLAERDENGNPTTGVTRHVVGAGESYIDVNNGTVDPSAHPYSWNISDYLNIYIITDLEGAAGVYYSGYDAVYIDANILNSGLMAHEVGHYFSLAHPFAPDGGTTCPTNNDCLADGDFVCDTPPKDVSGFGGASACNSPNNSCTTDTNDTSTNNPYRPTGMGGLGDVPDILENYMDYTGSCWAAFTQGQKDRMRFNIENNRASMLSSDKCTPFTNNDASIAAVVAPNDIACSGSESVIVTLSNNGSNTLTSATINVELDGGNIITFNWTGSLAPGATVDVTVGTATFGLGTHNIYAYTTLPNGVADEYDTNDPTCVDFLYAAPVTTLQSCEDFESGTLGSTWSSTNPNAVPPFEVTSTISGCGDNGNDALLFDAWNNFTFNNGQSYNLVSVTFDLSNYTNASLAFDVAYQRSFSNVANNLDISVSSDCGLTSSSVFSKGENSGLATVSGFETAQTFVPDACGDWRTETVDLSAYDGMSITLTFAITSDTDFFGQALYLDNICVDGDQTTNVCAGIGDADGDGICTDVDCDDNDASITDTDLDGDGVCTADDCNDNDASLYPGAPCTDGDNTTTNDMINTNCECIGTPTTCTGIGDADGDGVCADIDCDDNDATNTAVDIDGDGVCNDVDCVDNNPSIYPGATCNDGDDTTLDDIYDSTCTCAGTPTTCTGIGDADGDGVCADIDCDDNDATNTAVDIDGDGVCSDVDCVDNNPSIYPGASCNDGDGTTINDMYDSTCTCTGTPTSCTGIGDADSDGVCTDIDCDDNNPLVTTVDIDGDGVCNDEDCNDNDATIYPGASCDDGDNTTINDVYDGACDCAGTPTSCTGIGDADGDGVCADIDCDDNNATVTTVDADGDGLCNDEDCNDNDATIYPGATCDDGNAATTADVYNDQCLCVGELVDCLGMAGGTALPGTACDDGDDSTGDDTWNNNCECVGVSIDCDGVVGGSALPGTSCDDGDATTGDDTWDADCNCVGLPLDCEGVIGGPAQTGTACDDGDATTGDDTWDADCNCVGLPLDCEGVAGGPAIDGAPCDDGDATTGDDVYDANCNCAGLPLDCEGTPGGTAIPDATCDDGDATTGGDTWDANCNCVGLPLDCAGTPGGTATAGTACDDGDDTTGDDTYDANCNCIGLPLDCEGTPGGTALPNTACDDGNPNSQNDMWNNDCACIGELEGCTNALATNFDPLATIDDGSCIVEGCTDPTASNYNANATADDGSCNFDCTLDGEVSQMNAMNGGAFGFYYDNFTVELSNFNGPLTYDIDRTGYVRVELGQDGILSIIAADNATFTITVTDADGCVYIIDEDGFGVSNNAGDGLGGSTSTTLDISDFDISNDEVGPDNTGSIDITVGGGSGGYTYDWTGPNGFTATTQDIYNAGSGWYTVTVTDSDGQQTTGWYWVPMDRSGGRLKTADNNVSYMNAYPNPFSQQTTIEVAVAQDTKAQLVLYDMSGRNLSTLFNGQLSQGALNTFQLDANQLMAGTYFCQLITENGTAQTYKLVIIE